MIIHPQNYCLSTDNCESSQLAELEWIMVIKFYLIVNLQWIIENMYPRCSTYGIFTYIWPKFYGKCTHRRLRLPKVPQFRDWFGVSWLLCTFKHIPHSTFRVLNFRDWFGVSCLYCTLQSTLETTFRVFIHLGLLPSLFRKQRSLTVNVGLNVPYISAFMGPKIFQGFFPWP